MDTPIFQLKSKIQFGEGSLASLKKIEGHRALIVADEIMNTLGYLDTVKAHLDEAEITYATFTGVKPDPDVKVVAEGIKVFEAICPDVVIAIGGGSSIDAAKAILYTACTLNPEKMKPYFVAIPSTSGTGSEVTDFSVITSADEKICLIHPTLAPDLAILDSECIKNVPKPVIADTGIDVLVHALEAYVSKDANDFTDALAEKSVALIFAHLAKHQQNPHDQRHREAVQNASCMAGMAFTNTGLGINHSMAHAFGATFHVPHGRSNAMFLETVIAFNADLQTSANSETAKRYAKLAKMIGYDARTAREGTYNLITAIKKLKKDLGTPLSISALGIDANTYKQSVESMANKALVDRCTPTNPQSPTLENLCALYHNAY